MSGLLLCLPACLCVCVCVLWEKVRLGVCVCVFVSATSLCPSVSLSTALQVHHSVFLPLTLPYSICPSSLMTPHLSLLLSLPPSLSLSLPPSLSLSLSFFLVKCWAILWQEARQCRVLQQEWGTVWSLNTHTHTHTHIWIRELTYP